MRCALVACLAVAACLLPSGCGLDAQLEARTVCFTRAALIPAASGSGTVETDIGYDVGAQLHVLTQPGVSYRLTLQELDLSVPPGSPPVDLGGVDEVDVSVLAPAGTSLADTPLIHYLKGADPHPARIAAAAERSVDLRPYLAGGWITFHTLARGALSPQPWTADARACFLLDVNVRYGISAARAGPRPLPLSLAAVPSSRAP